MREIKFRAWDKDNFEFLDLDNSDVQIELTKEGLIARVFNCGEGWTPDQGYFEKPSWDIANAEFMQFTGLKDKNGVEIYEGDIILKQGIGNFKEVNEKSVVKIINGNTYGYYDDTDKELISNMKFPIEVIGNIYENTELLDNK